MWNQRTTCGILFSPSTLWIMEVELRMSDMRTSTFNGWTILQTPNVPCSESTNMILFLLSFWVQISLLKSLWYFYVRLQVFPKDRGKYRCVLGNSSHNILMSTRQSLSICSFIFLMLKIKHFLKLRNFWRI